MSNWLSFSKHIKIFIVCFLLISVSGCQPIQPDPQQPPETQDVEKYNAWVPGHVILIGTNGRNELDQVATDLNLAPIDAAGAAPIQIGSVISRDYPGDTTQTNSERTVQFLLSRSFEPDITQTQVSRISDGDLIAKLYDLTKTSNWNAENPDESLKKVIDQVNEQRQKYLGSSEGSYILAQPNFWLSASVQSLDCNDITGTTGSSSIKGGPFDAPMPSSATETDFMNQPALKRLADNGTIQLTDSPTGRGVQVVVFDSSPFASTTDGEIFELPATEELLLRDVDYPPGLTDSSQQIAGLDNHGLFVARLLKSVAPKSRIDLVRVLDNNACGESYVLDSAINKVISSTENINAMMVLNFSLGYHLNGQVDYLSQLFSNMASDRPNTVIVAAAGNEGQSRPALYPAGYYTSTSTLAVAGINMIGDPSCFSNQGNVSAMAGQGSLSPPLCPDPADPNDKVISITSSGDYAYWIGTSFATPIVSGLVARCLSSGLSASQTISALTLGGGQHEVTLDMCLPANP